jgi:hypothetical protein
MYPVIKKSEREREFYRIHSWYAWGLCVCMPAEKNPNDITWQTVEWFLSVDTHPSLSIFRGGGEGNKTRRPASV